MTLPDALLDVLHAKAWRSWALRGSVVAARTEGARENVDELSRKYLGRPYPGFGGGPQQRVILTVKVDRVHTP